MCSCGDMIIIIIIIIIIISVLTKLKETPYVETTSIQLSSCPYEPCFELFS